MLWSERINRLAGAALVILAGLVIVNTALFISTMSDADVFSRTEINDYLKDLQDNRTVAGLTLATSILIDTIFGILAAGLIYILLSGRNRTLALLGAIFIVAASAVFMVADGLTFSLIYLADDFAKGGAGGLPAGNATTVEIARVVAVGQSALLQAGFTALATGFLAYSILIVGAPLGAVNPPRWIGWVGIISALAGYLSWLIVLSDNFFPFFIITGLAQLIWLLGFGIWLLMKGDNTGTAAAAA